MVREHADREQFVREQDTNGINLQDKNGWTALHHGSKNGHLEIAKILIGAGADARVTDAHGRTAADVAREQGHLEIAEYIESTLPVSNYMLTRLQ
jgi:ankyrin repeat protein